jgi:hypothetical protein
VGLGDPVIPLSSNQFTLQRDLGLLKWSSMRKLFVFACALLLVAFTWPISKMDWRHELFLKVYCLPTPSWVKQQINADLAAIKPSDLTSEKLDQALIKGDWVLARYRIRNAHLESEYPPALQGHPRGLMIENTLREILSVVSLPDLDCLICLGDSADGCDFPAPVLAFARNDLLHKPIILMPDFEALEGNANFINEVRKGNARYPWEKKLEQAIWRGAMTGQEFTAANFLEPPRSQLVALSLSHPEWLDARYIAVSQCTEPELVKSLFAPFFLASAQVRDHLAYKYQVLVDGNTCAYSRAYWQLFSRCLIFKHDSPHIQWYYRALKPNVHYIPVHPHFQNLVEKIQWAKEHDEASRKIAEAAHTFARDNLRKSDVRAYLVLLLKKYAALQSSI